MRSTQTTREGIGFSEKILFFFVFRQEIYTLNKDRKTNKQVTEAEADG